MGRGERKLRTSVCRLLPLRGKPTQGASTLRLRLRAQRCRFVGDDPVAQPEVCFQHFSVSPRCFLLSAFAFRRFFLGPNSRRRPQTHRRGQYLHSGPLNAKNAPESAICGVLRNRPTPTGSVPWPIPISFPSRAPRRAGRTNLRSDANLFFHAHAKSVTDFTLRASCLISTPGGRADH
jgi:hypothetical protein